MEGNPAKDAEEEEEYVMLNFDSISSEIHIPPNEPYVLSGLDTPNPVLAIGDNLKLIGEYEETVGTCLVFTEKESEPVVHKEIGPSEANGKSIIDPNQAPTKQVKPLTTLHKVLKFRLIKEDENNANDVTVTPETSS